MEEKKEEFTARIGPKLRALLDRQKEIIESVTYGCVNSSDWEAGEIIATKLGDKI